MWQFASLSTTTGTPSPSAITSANATSLSGSRPPARPCRCANRTCRGRRSRPLRSAPGGSADLLDRLGDQLLECVLGVAVHQYGWYVESLKGRRRPPASSFVPPRSTPMTYPWTSRHPTSACLTPATTPHPSTRSTAESPGSWAGAGETMGACATRSGTSRPAPDTPPDPGRAPTPRRRRGPRPRVRLGRILRWLLVALVPGWRSRSSSSWSAPSSSRRRLDGRRRAGRCGLPADLPNTILVLGSDARTKGSKEPGREQDPPAEPLGLDPADADRRGQQLAALDPPRHHRRHPRQRPRTRSTRPTLSAAPRWRSRRSSSTSASRSTT